MIFKWILLILTVVVVESGRRVTDSDRLDALAAAQRRGEHLDRTRAEQCAHARRRARENLQRRQGLHALVLLRKS